MMRKFTGKYGIGFIKLNTFRAWIDGISYPVDKHTLPVSMLFIFWQGGVRDNMYKELLSFLNGEKNAITMNAIISRELLPNGIEHVFIKTFDGEICLYDFWYNPKAKKASGEPKNIGGQKPFAKLFLQELGKLRAKGLTDEIAGSMLRLSDHITWSTGWLKNKRTRKLLTFDDMVNVLGLSRGHTSKRIKQFKNLGILENTDKGYKVSPNLIKKGGAENKDNNLPTGI